MGQPAGQWPFEDAIQPFIPKDEPSVPERFPPAPVPAGPEDLFEDVTERAGIRFVHQFCDTKIANIIESNGAGGRRLDYDGDGWMDLFLVNSGPLDGVTHHAPGTARQPNRLYRNHDDGTFEDVTQNVGVANLGGTGIGAVFLDADNDGLLDLFVANYLTFDPNYQLY
jgi:hypothetical protein